MPSNFTKNYSLSQWERSDKVLMDDFNADNAKIDAALAFHPSAELICSVTVEEETTQLELDISQVDWSRYMALALIADSPNSTGYKINMNGGAERTIFMYRNSYGPNALTELCFSPITSHITMITPVFYDGNHALSAVCFGSGEDDGGFGFLGGGGGSNPLNVCKYVKIQRCNGSFQPGDRAVLWGVK